MTLSLLFRWSYPIGIDTQMTENFSNVLVVQLLGNIFFLLFGLAWVGFLWFDWIQVRQHQQEDLANKQVGRKMIISMMIRTIFMEICGSLCKECKTKLTKSLLDFESELRRKYCYTSNQRRLCLLNKVHLQPHPPPFLCKYPKREDFISCFWNMSFIKEYL